MSNVRQIEAATLGLRIDLPPDVRTSVERIGRPLGACSRCKTREATILCAGMVFCSRCDRAGARVGTSHRAALTSTLVLVGHAALFDVDLPLRAGHAERLRPDAFRGVLRREAPIELRVNHRPGAYASTTKGTLTLREDAAGLWFEARITLDAADRRELATLVRAGRLHGVSPGWTGERETWNRGRTVRTLTDIGLEEISLITADRTPSWRGTWAAEAGPTAWAKQRAAIGAALDRVAG